MYTKLISSSQRFAEVESVCVLTNIIRNYRIQLSPDKEAQFSGLSILEKTRRLCLCESKLTLKCVYLFEPRCSTVSSDTIHSSPTDMPLMFQKRNRVKQ